MSLEILTIRTLRLDYVLIPRKNFKLRINEIYSQQTQDSRSNNSSPVIRVLITWLPYVFLYNEPGLNHMESNFAHFISKNSTLNNNKFN